MLYIFNLPINGFSILAEKWHFEMFPPPVADIQEVADVAANDLPMMQVIF